MSLPRQGTSTGKPWSLTRDNQTRTELESGIDAVIGKGIIGTGTVTKVSGYTARLASGTVVFSKGVKYTLAAAQDFTVNVAPTAPATEVTVYVWAKLTRTAADQDNPTDEDTYFLSITHELNNEAPSDDHFPLAIFVNDSSGIVTITEPSDKYLETEETVKTITIYAEVMPGDNVVLKVDFSNIGRFDGDYHVRASIDQDPTKTLISELIGNKSGTVCYLLIQNSSSAAAGSYYSNRDLEITLRLQGWGWVPGAGGGAVVTSSLFT